MRSNRADSEAECLSANLAGGTLRARSRVLRHNGILWRRKTPSLCAVKPCILRACLLGSTSSRLSRPSRDGARSGWWVRGGGSWARVWGRRCCSGLGVRKPIRGMRSWESVQREYVSFRQRSALDRRNPEPQRVHQSGQRREEKSAGFPFRLMDLPRECPTKREKGWTRATAATPLHLRRSLFKSLRWRDIRMSQWSRVMRLHRHCRQSLSKMAFVDTVAVESASCVRVT